MSKKQDNLVRKSNSIVRSSWIMDSIWEARLVALVASKTRVDDIDFKEHEIPISEILEGAEIRRSGQIYDLIEKAAKKMVSKVITIREPSGKTIIAGVFAQCEIDPGTGIIKIAFAPALKPHYLQLKERYTLYSLEEFLQLPSIYSQRLFEILTSWKNFQDGEVTITMDELHEQLDTPPSQRKDFKLFRQRVLEKAQKDISNNPDASLDYEWEAVKKGRKVIAVRFIFDRRKVQNKSEAKRIAAERENSKRNNELFIQATKCSRDIADISNIDEQLKIAEKQEKEVCFICKQLEMLKPLFPFECHRYGADF